MPRQIARQAFALARHGIEVANRAVADASVAARRRQNIFVGYKAQKEYSRSEWNSDPMTDDTGVDRKLSTQEAEELMNRVMKRQAGLSLRVAAIFIAILVLLPLFNLFAPDLAADSVFGFPLSWLILGILFYPLTWLLSNYFVANSDRIEAEITRDETR